jgi:hypothetical protein
MLKGFWIQNMKAIESIKQFSSVEINKKRLYRRVMQSKSSPPNWLVSEIESCMGGSSLELKGIYAFFNFYISKNNDGLLIQNEKFESRFLAIKFTFAKEVGLFIITVGDDITNKAREATKHNDGLQSLIYDSIGSEYAESTADAMQKVIEKEKGYCMSRYSPGYNDWPITDQEKLFRLIDGSKIDVNLTKSSFMQPEKSISAVIGFSDTKMYGCKNCNQVGCVYR